MIFKKFDKALVHDLNISILAETLKSFVTVDWLIFRQKQPCHTHPTPSCAELLTSAAPQG